MFILDLITSNVDINDWNQAQHWTMCKKQVINNGFFLISHEHETIFHLENDRMRWNIQVKKMENKKMRIIQKSIKNRNRRNAVC